VYAGGVYAGGVYAVLVVVGGVYAGGVYGVYPPEGASGAAVIAETGSMTRGATGALVRLVVETRGVAVTTVTTCTG
jgi:hypothetical protein